MARTFINQLTQIARSETFDDTLAPSVALETGAANLEDDLNSIRSVLSLHLDVQAGNWYDDLVAPVTFEGGAKRGVQDLNADLHDFERKRVLVHTSSLVDVTVGAGNNYVILGTGQLPANTTAAVGAVTTLGTVVAAHGGTFGTHSLTEVGGSTAISPKNLCAIVDGATRDPILSGGRTVYALLQTETVTDGHTITDTTTTRAQLSFVRINAGGNDLEAVPFADIENQVINYTSVTRKALEDLTEQDFLRGAEIDVPSAAVVTRQVAYDNQGANPVDVTTHSYLDLEGPGLTWQIRDDLEATIFSATEGSAGGTTNVTVGTAVDTFTVDAIINDFDQGIRVDTGDQRINVGETAGLIESTGVNDLRVLGAGELYFDDGNQTGSTWAQTSGIKLSETTTEWNNFETLFGEVSLLNAIYQAGLGSSVRSKVQATLTVNVSANNDVNGPTYANNTDVDLLPYNLVTFVDDVEVFLNGVLLRNNAVLGAEDVYPGTSPTNGDLRFTFALKGTGGSPDQLTIIVNGQ